MLLPCINTKQQNWLILVFLYYISISSFFLPLDLSFRPVTYYIYTSRLRPITSMHIRCVVSRQQCVPSLSSYLFVRWPEAIRLILQRWRRPQRRHILVADTGRQHVRTQPYSPSLTPLMRRSHFQRAQPCRRLQRTFFIPLIIRWPSRSPSWWHATVWFTRNFILSYTTKAFITGRARCYDDE